jgi:hypothetical protein
MAWRVAGVNASCADALNLQEISERRFRRLRDAYEAKGNDPRLVDPFQ